jgi:hypothetical protein
MSEQICVTFRNEYRPQPTYTSAFQSSCKTIALKRSTDPLQKYGKATGSSVTDLLNTSVSYNIKSVIAELEKRRSEFSALACAAEARAREAEEKCEQAENRLKQETNQRLVVEQRLREFEADRLRQQQSVEIERVKTQKAVNAQGEAEARLKKVENRMKEAENDATSLTLALAKAYQKRSEAEASARAVEEKANIIQALFLRSETAKRVTIEGQLIFGLLIFASRSKMKAMERAIRNVEARHRPKEDYLKNLLEKPTAKLHAIPEKTTVTEGDPTSLNLLKSVEDYPACHVTVQNGLWIKFKFMIYGMVIMLMIGGCWELIKAFLQI